MGLIKNYNEPTGEVNGARSLRRTRARTGHQEQSSIGPTEEESPAWFNSRREEHRHPATQSFRARRRLAFASTDAATRRPFCISNRGRLLGRVGPSLGGLLASADRWILLSKTTAAWISTTVICPRLAEKGHAPLLIESSRSSEL